MRPTPCSEAIALLLVLALALAGPAAATSIDVIASRAAEVPLSELEDDEWPFQIMPPSLREALRRAVLEGDADGAVAGLTAWLDGDRDAAEAVLGGTLALLAEMFPECDEPGLAPRAARIEEELLAVLERHPVTDDVVVATALFYGLWSHCLPSEGDRLIERVSGLAAGSGVALELAVQLDEYGPLRPRLLAVAAGEGPPALPVLEAMAETVDSALARAALFESAQAVAARTAPERAAEFARRRIETLLSAGLGGQAIEAFEQAPESARRSIVEGASGPDAEDGEASDLRLDLAAAMALERDLEGARRILAAVPAERRVVPPRTAEADGEESDAAGLHAVEARLWQALDRLLADGERRDDPFGLLAELALAVDSYDTDLTSRSVLHQALSQLASRAGYRGFASYFFGCFESVVSWEADSLDPPAGSASPREDAFANGFPQESRRARGLLERLRWQEEALAGEFAAAAPVDPLADRIDRLLARPRLVPFDERPLPEGVPAGSRGKPEIPAGLAPPTGLAMVRAERRDDLAVVVGVAQALDPVGEISSGAYWVARSTDGGASWTRLYTGLRALQPYQVVERSALPLISADGVWVEVHVRELDEGSITFPPVGLQLKREQDGLYLDIAWRELERDRDGDGLTDLVEERILTNPEASDTDGDGVGDAEDPIPSVPFAAGADPASEALAALLAEIQGEEARAILPRGPDGEGLCFGRVVLGEGKTHFVVGERSPWSALSPGLRTVVLTPEELAAAEAKFGVLFATEFPLIEVDGRGEEAVIIWSRRWQGGAAVMHRSDQGWEVEIRNCWLT